MDWNDLKCFTVLAATGTLSAAARRLKVDHSTVARRIATLEEHLGARLFDRMPRGYVLTPDGERLVEQAMRVEEEVFALERLAQEREGAASGTVRISAPPGFAGHFLALRLAALRDRHPAIHIELSGDMGTANLSRREADVALRLARPDGNSLVVRRVGSVGFGLFCAPAYAVSKPREEWDFLGYEESQDHVPQQKWLHGFSGGKSLVFRSNDLASLMNAARAGMGVTVLPFFMGPVQAGLVQIETNSELAPQSRDLWMVAHSDVRRSPAVRIVMDHLADLIDRDRAFLEGTSQPISGHLTGTDGSPAARTPELSA
jgi:DNA-binding transcriptional LysR family regulator